MDYPRAWLQTLSESKRDSLLSTVLSTLAATSLFALTPLLPNPLTKSVLSASGCVLTGAALVSNKRRETLEGTQKALGLLDEAQTSSWYNRRLAAGSGATTAHVIEEITPMPSLVDYWQKQDKHLLITAGTGSGKSTCVQAIANQLSGWKFSLWDIDASVEDWQNLRHTDCTLLEDYASIRKAMVDELAEQERRIDEGKAIGWKAYKNTARPSLTIAEEFPALASELDGAGDWLRSRAKRGRKPRMFFCIVTQNTTTANLGTQGDSKIIDSCFVTVLLGSVAIARAKQLKQPALVRWLEEGGYDVCLVDDKPCIRPQITSENAEIRSTSKQSEQLEVRNSGHFSPEVNLSETKKSGISEAPEVLPKLSVSEQLRAVLGEQRWQLLFTEAEKIGIEPATLVSEVRKLFISGASQTAIIRKLWQATGGQKYTDAKALLIILSEQGLTK